MKLTLKYLLYLIFVISLLTGMNGLIGGAAAIPGATPDVVPAIDNELRCISVFWLTFGGFCFWVARNIDSRYYFIPPIALVIFLSGLARLLSILLVGMPSNPLFAAMMIEFILFVAVYFTYSKWKAYRLAN
ncbi:MAG: DUF4345 domain-containing protein [Gammaproteobacteria bacterium]|nr:MAG: DUF4345 domain-containing protein [Gammaproteobacteria bacterium]